MKYLSDYYFNDNPICPYCDYVNDGSYYTFFGDDALEIECDECGEHFSCTVYTGSTTYSTHKIDHTVEA